MGKLIQKNGRFYRERRGVLVEIPGQWLGNVVYRQTIHKRLSKKIGKLAKPPNPKYPKHREEEA